MVRYEKKFPPSRASFLLGKAMKIKQMQKFVKLQTAIASYGMCIIYTDT